MGWFKKALKWVAGIVIAVVLVVAVIFAVATYGAGLPLVGAWATAAAGWLSATTMFGVSLATWSVIAGVIGLTLGFATGLISINLATGAMIQGADSADNGDVNYDTYFMNDPSAVSGEDNGQTELDDDLSGWSGVGSETDTGSGSSESGSGGHGTGAESPTDTTRFEPFDPGPQASGEPSYVDTWDRPARDADQSTTSKDSGLTTNQKVGLAAAAGIMALLLLGGE